MKRRVSDNLEGISNGGADTIMGTSPYVARVTIRGTSALLFHRWNCESVAAKAGAPKGSREKRSDDVDSYVFRDEKGHICLPGVYLARSVIEVGRYAQDPRSPRKSARDLYSAMLHATTALAPITIEGKPVDSWQFLDQRRVTIQRSSVTRSRPAFYEGWEASIDLLVCDRSYVPSARLHQEVTRAGQLVGVGDFRPSFGRFAVAEFKVVTE